MSCLKLLKKAPAFRAKRSIIISLVCFVGWVRPLKTSWRGVAKREEGRARLNRKVQFVDADAERDAVATFTLFFRLGRVSRLSLYLSCNNALGGRGWEGEAAIKCAKAQASATSSDGFRLLSVRNEIDLQTRHLCTIGMVHTSFPGEVGTIGIGYLLFGNYFMVAYQQGIIYLFNLY
jgi:hypothetical protein